MDYAKTLEMMQRWAREAGEIQLSHFRDAHLAVDTKYNDYDVVTVADKESEKSIISHIREAFPDHAILAEESGDNDADSDWRWVIDPLDGTTNYSQGLPIFSVSIALEYRGESVLGVVFAPYLNEMFHAVKGEGAFLNGKKINCSAKSELSNSVACTGMPVDRAENPDNNFDNIAAVVNNVRGLRRYGSAAVDLCYVAAGFFDAYWELALHRWDVAAGELIAAEAGARVEYLRPERPWSILACGSNLYDKFRPLIH